MSVTTIELPDPFIYAINGGSVKYEFVFLNAFETGNEARTGIGCCIGYYNANRPHSEFGAGRRPRLS
jgi:hypothetical protein